MKKLYTIILLILIMFVAGKSSAVIHIVNVSDFAFAPAALNVTVGDTIQWNWLSGSHTTTSTSVPAGAPTWDSPISSSIPVFQYIVTVPGTYTYWCTPHQPSMSGSFEAAPSTGISSNKKEKSVNVYPNPFQRYLVVDIQNHQSSTPVKLEIFNVLGKQVFSKEFLNINEKNNIDLNMLNPGMYFIYIITEEKKMFKIFKESDTSYLPEQKNKLLKEIAGNNG